MKVDFQGRTWQLETADVDMEQGLAVTGYTGLTLVAWEKSLLDPDSMAWLKSMRCLYWLMLAQNGESVQLATANFAPLTLWSAFAEAAAAEAEASGAAAEADPTRPAGEPAAADPMPPAHPDLRG